MNQQKQKPKIIFCGNVSVQLWMDCLMTWLSRLARYVHSDQNEIRYEDISFGVCNGNYFVWP